MLNTILLAWNVMVTIILVATIILVTRFYHGTKALIALASQGARQMGIKSGLSRKGKQRAQRMESAKGKLIEAFSSEIPGASSFIGMLKQRGVSDEDMWDWMTDPDILRGAKVFYDVFAKVGELGKRAMDKTGDKVGGKKEPKRRAIPLAR